MTSNDARDASSDATGFNLAKYVPSAALEYDAVPEMEFICPIAPGFAAARRTGNVGLHQAKAKWR